MVTTPVRGCFRVLSFVPRLAMSIAILMLVALAIASPAWGDDDGSARVYVFRLKEVGPQGWWTLTINGVDVPSMTESSYMVLTPADGRQMTFEVHRDIKKAKIIGACRTVRREMGRRLESCPVQWEPAVERRQLRGFEAKAGKTYYIHIGLEERPRAKRVGEEEWQKSADQLTRVGFPLKLAIEIAGVPRPAH